LFQPKQNSTTATKRFNCLAENSQYLHTLPFRPNLWLGAQIVDSVFHWLKQLKRVEPERFVLAERKQFHFVLLRFFFQIYFNCANSFRQGYRVLTHHKFTKTVIHNK